MAHVKRIVTIRPGTPFLRTVAQTLCDGSLTPHYRYDAADPLSLAKVTIYVPTRRSARVLRSEFVAVLGGKSTILPVIRALGESEDDSGYFDTETPATIDLAPPVSKTMRLVELARLILAWRNSLPDAIRAVHSDSPLVAPASPADAIWLARALGEVIDAMDTEELDWKALKNLDTLDHAKWWELTAQFLKIASEYWPARLIELNRSSAGRHSNAILRAEADRLGKIEHAGPVIVAGSTGAVPAAAELIRSVSVLPVGVVVIPGLDLDMPDDQWEVINEKPEDPSSRTHSQYGLYKLLRTLGVLRRDVDVIGDIDDERASRAALLSAALAPSKATSEWNEWRAGKNQQFFASAFEHTSLIEAGNEREEATSIAIALKLALDKPGQFGESRAALITPDRGLARRVANELRRFGIEADDSAGTPLSSTTQATLLQLLLEAILNPSDPVAVLSLLKHPLSRFGLSQERYQAGAAALELIAMRGGRSEVLLASINRLFESRIAENAIDRHPPQWRQALSEEAIEAARELSLRIEKAVEPLSARLFTRAGGNGWMSEKLPISLWAEHSGRVLEAIAIDEDERLTSLWAGEAGSRLATLLSELMDCGSVLEADGRQWIDIILALTTGEATKPRSMANPRVFIFGAMESRLQNIDTVVLGAMNEGNWPSQTANNPFLSRSMKTAIGLEPPERSVGQLAHDFEMANGASHVIYSRALRQGTTPSVASRWLQRLMALAGPEASEGLKLRGRRYLDWAHLLDDGPDQEAARRPAPMPPADLQPTRYSFSEVSKLRRDPYAIYARRILKLDPIDGLNEDPGASDRGTLYHRIIELYSQRGLVPGTPSSHQAMDEIIDLCFAEMNLPVHIDVIWRPRFRSVATSFIAWEEKRHRAVERSHFEARAGFDIPEARLRLTGIADRIDILKSGGADIIDYKTGMNPTAKQARALLDPQLSLEAAVLLRGGFRDVPKAVPKDLLYVRLKPGDGFKTDRVNNEDATRAGTVPKTAVELAGDAIDQLARFTAALREGRNGYASRLIPEQQNAYGTEYDHLARVSEWSTTEEGDGDAE
jgi:ATP-dependent helicase/nuclease subunit B